MRPFTGRFGVSIPHGVCEGCSRTGVVTFDPPYLCRDCEREREETAAMLIDTDEGRGPLTADVRIRKHRLTAWMLNKVGSALTDLLPARVVSRLWCDWLGWIPILRWQVKGDDAWQTVTLRQAIDKGIRDAPQ